MGLRMPPRNEKFSTLFTATSATT
ncbi:MAG: hypothetical protein QOI83_3208, partial [Streptomycetaceae bacterium]|nr:hypothetical protein [Streptomycetaceae bacterium]